MYDLHGYYGQPSLTAPQFLPQSPFSPGLSAFGSLGGWPGQFPPFGAQGLGAQGLGAQGPGGQGFGGQGFGGQGFGGQGPGGQGPGGQGFGGQGPGGQGFGGQGFGGQGPGGQGFGGQGPGGQGFGGQGPGGQGFGGQGFGQLGGFPGQQTGHSSQQMGPLPFGSPIGGWPGQTQLACITPQGLVAILPPQLTQQILPQLVQSLGGIGPWAALQQLGGQHGALAGRGFQPYQTTQMAYA